MSEEFKVINPANRQEIDRVKKDSVGEIERKVKRGHEKYLEYKKVKAHKRTELLFKWQDKIEEKQKDIANHVTLEGGKPYAEALGEVESANSYIKYYAEEAKRIYGRTVPSDKDNNRIVVTRHPIGLVAAITPWNFPVAMMARKA